MTFLRHVCCTALLSVSLLAACSKDKQPDTGKKGGSVMEGPLKGYATGTVTDQSGKPLKDVQIAVSTPFSQGIDLAGTTNGNGKYKIKTANQPLDYTYYVAGYLYRVYHAITYRIPLHQEDLTTFRSTEGGVRNLRWKLTGLRSAFNGPATLYYGGDVSVSSNDPAIDVNMVRIKLEPTDVLIDGSTGKTLVVDVKYYSGIVQGLRDIPIGRYKMSATCNGRPVLIKNISLDAVNEQVPYAASIEADFTASHFTGVNDYWIRTRLSTEAQPTSFL